MNAFHYESYLQPDLTNPFYFSPSLYPERPLPLFTSILPLFLDLCPLLLRLYRVCLSWYHVPCNDPSLSISILKISYHIVSRLEVLNVLIIDSIFSLRSSFLLSRESLRSPGLLLFYRAFRVLIRPKFLNYFSLPMKRMVR